MVTIETPDFEGCVQDFLAAKTLDHKGEILRHIFGSEEANWAIHYDGWFEEKFRFVFQELGFDVVRVERMRSNVSKQLGLGLHGVIDTLARAVPAGFQNKVGINTLPNIAVTARKTSAQIDEVAAIREILSIYLVGKEHGHSEILDVWMRQIKI